MKVNVLITILIMAGVTYLIRVLPLVLIRREIKNTTVRSFLHYVPYVTLSVMTFPAILTATDSIISASVGFITALAMAFWGKSLITVALSACASVFIVELLIKLF